MIHNRYQCQKISTIRIENLINFQKLSTFLRNCQIWLSNECFFILSDFLQPEIRLFPAKAAVQYYQLRNYIMILKRFMIGHINRKSYLTLICLSKHKKLYFQEKLEKLITKQPCFIKCQLLAVAAKKYLDLHLYEKLNFYKDIN